MAQINLYPFHRIAWSRTIIISRWIKFFFSVAWFEAIPFLISCRSSTFNKYVLFYHTVSAPSHFSQNWQNEMKFVEISTIFIQMWHFASLCHKIKYPAKIVYRKSVIINCEFWGYGKSVEILPFRRNKIQCQCGKLNFWK